MKSFVSIGNAIKNLSIRRKCFIAVLGTTGIATILLISLYPRPERGDVCRTDACYSVGKSIQEAMDSTVDPCNDFYSYCCGHWSQKEEFPPNLNRYGLLEKLNIDVMSKLYKLLSSKDVSPESFMAVENMKRYYDSCMNQAAIEKKGTEPLRNLLFEIGGWPAVDKTWSTKSFDLLSSMATVQLKTSYGFIIPIIISADPKNTSRNVIQLDQPTLSFSKSVLQEENNTATQKEVSNYKIFFSKISNLLEGDAVNIEYHFQDILHFERNIFGMMSKEENVNDVNFWSSMTVEELHLSVPEINWLQYFQKVTNYSLSSMGVNNILHNTDNIIVRDFPYLKAISKFLIQSQNYRQTANYLGWKLIISQIASLPSSFSKAAQEYSTDNGFVQKAPDRWETCTTRANAAFSYAAAYVYIKKHFPTHVKRDVLKLAYDLKFQFQNILENNSWMDNITRNAALQKLHVMKVNVGYPEWIEDGKHLDDLYNETNMPQMTDNAFENEIAISNHKTMISIKSIRKKNEKQDWPMTPITINAGYNRNLNSITFPAAFLQLPLYDKSLPSYYNYAAIGSVIGHEITHGFDNEGSKRNSAGEIENWWSKNSKQIFEEKADCFVHQYQKYGVNGKRTLAENIADNGGLRQAYQAFALWRKENNAELLLPGLENFNIEQLFFLSYGSIWCTKYRESALNFTILHAVHSPSPFRLNLTVANLEHFSNAFGCKPNLPQKVNETCSIW